MGAYLEIACSSCIGSPAATREPARELIHLGCACWCCCPIPLLPIITFRRSNSQYCAELLVQLRYVLIVN